MGGNEFRIKVIAKQVTDFDKMFKFMEDKNLFSFWQNEQKKDEEREYIH